MARKLLLSLILLFSTNLFSQWNQTGADIDGEFPYDYSADYNALDISADGSVVIIGSHKNDTNGTESGQAIVYKNINNTWTQIGANLNGLNAYDRFGCSVSINADGTIIAIGAKGDDGGGQNAGQVRVFQYSSGSWIQIGSDINGVSDNEDFGYSISLSASGTKLVVGAPKSDYYQPSGGYAKIFEYTNNTWSLINTIAIGNPYESSGSSVDISSDGNIIVVGAPNPSGSFGSGSGRVFTYNYDGGATQQILVGENPYEKFGLALTISGDGKTIAAGMRFYNEGTVRVFKSSLSNWSKQGDIDGTTPFGAFGSSVSLNNNGSILAIGDVAGDDNGATYIYEVLETYPNFSQIGNKIIGESYQDQCGTSIALSYNGSIVAIGANNNSSQAGHVRVFSNPTLSTVDFQIANIGFYPNPVQEYATISLNNNANYQIIDIKGIIVKQGNLTTGHNTLNLQKIAKGMYFLKVISKSTIATKKIN